jgi:hypothetical protein
MCSKSMGSPQGAIGEKDLINILEGRALPPMTPDEEAELMQTDPIILQEWAEYKFSLATAVSKFFAGALGLLNLGGAL